MKVDTTPRQRSIPIDSLFPGRKARWLPLYHRLAARLVRSLGLEARIRAAAIEFDQCVRIRVLPSGLELGLSLPSAIVMSKRLRTSSKSPKRITHSLVITGAADIDEELFLWIKASSAKTRKRPKRKRVSSR